VKLWYVKVKKCLSNLEAFCFGTSGTMFAGIGKVTGTAWSFTDMILGCILALSNALAGYLTDLTVARSMGNTGCFLGGAVASVAAVAFLLLFERFGHLGKALPTT
jgi:hypothetical protein